MTLNIENYQDILEKSKKIKSLYNKDVFPYAQKYIENPKFKDKDWITTRSDKDPDLPVTLFVIIDEEELSNSVHISCVETALPIRGYGYGLESLQLLIDTIRNNGYEYVTLRLADPSLENFYSQVGFEPWYDDNMILRVN